MNRIIPSFVEDDGFNSLSLGAEVFFRRLWNEADDYGRFDARPAILKSRLYPLRDVRLPDISRFLLECEKAGLIACYEVYGAAYLQILRFWSQSLRRSKAKYPPKPDGCFQSENNCIQPVSNCFQSEINCFPEDEDEEEDDKEKVEKEIFDFLPADFAASSDFREVWGEWIRYRKQRKLSAWVEATLRQRAKTFEAWGVAGTVQNIRFSIAQGYQGIFEDKTRERRQNGNNYGHSGKDLSNNKGSCNNSADYSGIGIEEL